VRVVIAGSQPQAQRLLRTVVADALEASATAEERRVAERRRPPEDAT
jgi:hypothetical protein